MAPSIFLLLSLATPPIFAQTSNTSIWSWGGQLGTLNINKESAIRERIKNDATVLGLFANHQSNWFFTSLGLDFITYNDNDSFTQATSNGFGRRNASSSSANATNIFMAIGPKLTIGTQQNAIIYTQVGLSSLFESDRSISNCSNCFSEDINIESGAFTKTGFKFKAGAVALGADYIRYTNSEDLEDSITLSVSTYF